MDRDELKSPPIAIRDIMIYIVLKDLEEAKKRLDKRLKT